MLVTRRALGKRTWPGVWTNSFCGHPAPGETIEDAVAPPRRSTSSVSRSATLELVLPDFRYRATDAAGIVENEICPVLHRDRPRRRCSPTPDEVAECAWADPARLAPRSRRPPSPSARGSCLQLAALLG